MIGQQKFVCLVGGCYTLAEWKWHGSFKQIKNWLKELTSRLVLRRRSSYYLQNSI